METEVLEQESEDPKNFDVEASLDVSRPQEFKEILEDKSKRAVASKSLQSYLDNLEAIDSYTSTSLCVNPKNYDLEEDSSLCTGIIEVLEDPNLTKKKCMVWWQGETIPYGKFRQNPDNIIFIVGEDAYGYSKKDLFEEYQETIKRKVKDLRPSMSNSSTDSSHTKNLYSDRNIYFDLNLNWEDNETLWISMNQILRVLEYSHPVYEIQKMKYSMHVWNLVPVKLK